MPDHAILPSLIALGLGFPLFWVVICLSLMKMGGFSRSADLSDLGAFVASYGTGSGRINGIGLNRCLVVDRYEVGFVVRLWWIFGGGKLVVRDADIVGITSERRWWLEVARLHLRDGTEYDLFGRPYARLMRHADALAVTGP